MPVQSLTTSSKHYDHEHHLTSHTHQQPQRLITICSYMQKHRSTHTCYLPSVAQQTC